MPTLHICMVVKSGRQGIYFQQQVMSVNGKNEKRC